MRYQTLFAGLFALSLTALGAPLFQDTYGGQTPGSTVGDKVDVYGALSKFDIDRIEFTNVSAGNITLNIYMNYNEGDTTLAPFTVGGALLNPGDLLFSLGGIFAYAVPLVNHDGLLAGDLYSITGAKTAKTVLNAALPDSSYRPDAFVLADPTGAQHKGDGTVTSAHEGAANSVEIKTTVSFTPDAAFFANLDNYTLDFASATCGNDLLSGNMGIPEPTTFILLGSGLVLLGCLRRKA